MWGWMRCKNYRSRILDIKFKLYYGSVIRRHRVAQRRVFQKRGDRRSLKTTWKLALSEGEEWEVGDVNNYFSKWFTTFERREVGIISMQEDLGGNLCKSLETSAEVTIRRESIVGSVWRGLGRVDSKFAGVRRGVRRSVPKAASLSLFILLTKYAATI